MKVILDHNVPKRLRGVLPDHIVRTAKEMGWAELENGDLLGAAERDQFELMVTCDQNLSYQQKLEGRMLALLVLNTNNWQLLLRKQRVIQDAIDRAVPGSFEFLQIRV